MESPRNSQKQTCVCVCVCVCACIHDKKQQNTKKNWNSENWKYKNKI